MKFISRAMRRIRAKHRLFREEFTIDITWAEIMADLDPDWITNNQKQERTQGVST